MSTDNFRSGPFWITIDGKPYEFDDPLLKGRDLLEKAGLNPVDEYLLFERQPDGMFEDVNLSEDIDLKQPGAEEFTTSKADRIFFLVIDGRRFPWGKDEISGAELRGLARIADDKDVLYDPKGGKDDLIDIDEVISLKSKDVEHFYTEDRPDEPRLVTVELNGEKVKIPAGDYTTETLKVALGVAAELDLDIVDKQGSFRTLATDEAIRVVAKLKFVSHVRQGGSS